MKFLKGAMIGALLGSTFVVMKDTNFNSIIKKSKKKLKKIKSICMI